MNKYHELQMRFQADEVIPGMEIMFHDKKYLLGLSIPETIGRSNLPIGVLMSGYTRQFLMIFDGRPAGAAWFYYYSSFEGQTWAVLDEMELDDASQQCA